MTARLLITNHSYQLVRGPDGHDEAPTLAGGALALVPAGARLDALRLEAAIEVAEDWLMPHAAPLRGEVLEVSDVTGRLQAGMDHVLSVHTSDWSVQDIEAFFLQVIDLATGRVSSPALQGQAAFVADLVLLRELAHHGHLRAIRLL